MFADEVRRAIEAAPRVALPAITAAMWKAYTAGQISDAEAEALSALIELRQTPSAQPSPDASGGSRRRVGSRPRTDASMARRRRWAAAGRVPSRSVAVHFTQAEVAVLAVVAVEVTKRGDCRLAVGHLAAVAGVSETTVRNALRRARELGFVTVEERRRNAGRSDTNLVRIISREWRAWLRLGPRREPRAWEGSSPGRAAVLSHSGSHTVPLGQERGDRSSSNGLGANWHSQQEQDSQTG